MSNSRTFSIAWSVPDSRFSFSQAKQALAALGLVVHPFEVPESFAGHADLAVLHSENFVDLDQLRLAYEQISGPILIVVNSREEESQVLKWPNLPLTTDICRSEALPEQLVDRVRRLMEAANPDHRWSSQIWTHQGLQKRLHDREYFDERLAREFANARKHCRSLTIAWLEVSGLGTINQTFGSRAGDQIMKAFVRTALENIRVVDWLAHYDHEEFCLVMPDTWLEEGRQVAERIKREIASVTVQVDAQKTLTPSVNIGIAELTDHEASFEDLIQKAAEAAVIEKIGK